MVGKPRRRWFRFRFGLRSLLMLVAIVAACITFIGWHVRLVDRRVELASLVWRRGGAVDRVPSKLKLSPAHAAQLPTFAWDWFGDVPCISIRIKEGSMTREEEEELAAVFSEADIYAATPKANPGERVRIIQDRTISETLSRAQRAGAEFD